ncbi:hypothetical protein ACFQYP_21565 [Nonomuraea antimicrobica]
MGRRAGPAGAGAGSGSLLGADVLPAAAALDLPADLPRPAVRTTEGGHVVFPLGPERSRAIRSWPGPRR